MTFPFPSPLLAAAGQANSATIDGTLGSADAGILAAVFFTVSGTTVSVIGQKNVASVTRRASGVYRITFTSTLSNSNYGIMATARHADTSVDMPMLVQPNRDTTSGSNTYSTTTLDVACQQPNDLNSTTDPSMCGIVVFDPASVSSSNYKAAASWTLSGTTLTLQRNLNIGSMAREAAGVYRANFASALSDANYSEFVSSRYPDTTNIALALSGQNRNTTIPSNLHTTSSLDMCTGRLNTSGGSIGNYEAGRGSVLIGESDVAPRGTLARVRFSMSGGVATIVKGYNVGSITVQGTGLYRINFTTPLSDANYAVFCSGKWAGSTDDDAPMISANPNSSNSRNLYSTGGVDIVAHNYGSLASGYFDPDFVNVWVLKPWLM